MSAARSTYEDFILQEICANVFLLAACNVVLLTSTLCGAGGGADGGSGGGGSERRRRHVQEIRARALLVLPPLVVVQPLVQDLDHCVFFQDLSVESTDPDAKQKKKNVSESR